MDYEYNKKMAEDLIRERRDKRKEVEQEKRANIEDELKEIKPEHKTEKTDPPPNPIKPKNLFSLNRSIFYHPIFGNAELFKLYIFCIGRANFKENKVFMGTRIITLKRGQFISSIAKITQAYNLNAHKRQCLTQKQIYVRIRVLKQANKLAIKGTNQFTLITVINYDKNQSQGQADGQANGNANGQTEVKRRANGGKQIIMNNKYNKENRVFFLESFLSDTQKKNFKNKPEFYKEKLLSVADYDVILVSCYLLEARNFGSEVVLNVNLKQDRIAHARSLGIISKLKSKEWLVIMANLRKNGRLSVDNCASAINARNNRA